VVGSQTVTVSTIQNTQASGIVVTYVYPATFSGCGQTGYEITVPQGCSVVVTATLQSSQSTTGVIDLQIKRDIVSWPDNVLADFTSTTTLISGITVITAGPFTASDLSGSGGLLGIGVFREYFLKVFWNGNPVYDPTNYATREWVKTSPCVNCPGPTSITITSSSSTSSSSTAVAAPLSVSASASPTSTTVGAPVAFTATATGGSSSYLFTWFFGDGTTSSLQNPSHAYAVAGSYTATVAVTSGTSSGTAAASVSVSPGAGNGCPANAVGTGAYCVVFTVVSSYSGATIQGAAVNVQSGGTSLGIFTTNSNGQAFFNLNAGSYAVTVSALNYKTYTWSETVPAGNAAFSLTLVNSGGGLSIASAYLGIAGLTGTNEFLLGLVFYALAVVLAGYLEVKK